MVAADLNLLTVPISLPRPSYAAILSGQSHVAFPESPASPRAAKKSFSSMFSGHGGIKIRPQGSVKGEPSILFTKEDIQGLAAPFKFALVGSFPSGKRPLMVSIRKFVSSLGLKTLSSVGLLHDNFILIHVLAEEEYSRILLRQVWYIEGVPMKVFKWTVGFNPLEESPVVPVWIGFPGLPIHFFNRSALFSIAASFGNPLKSDEPTASFSRPSVARVCVELDVSKVWSHRIWLGDDKEGIWQEVVVENPPIFCSFCNVLGHDHKNCSIKHPELSKNPIRTGEQQVQGVKKKAPLVSETWKVKGDHLDGVVGVPVTTIPKNLHADCQKESQLYPDKNWVDAAGLGISLTPLAISKEKQLVNPPKKVLVDPCSSSFQFPLLGSSTLSDIGKVSSAAQLASGNPSLLALSRGDAAVSAAASPQQTCCGESSNLQVVVYNTDVVFGTDAKSQESVEREEVFGSGLRACPPSQEGDEDSLSTTQELPIQLHHRKEKFYGPFLPSHSTGDDASEDSS